MDGCDGWVGGWVGGGGAGRAGGRVRVGRTDGRMDLLIY